MGKESAPVWFVMVSDFQCPFCKTWHDSTFRMIEKDYVETGKLRMAFINFPLHANSLPASVTAMCAAAQGKFWGTHDRIFDTQERVEGAEGAAPLSRLARDRVGRGRRKAESRARTATTWEPLIAADQARFQKAGVGGTPTFYIGNATMIGRAATEGFPARDRLRAGSAANKGKAQPRPGQERNAFPAPHTSTRPPARRRARPRT